MLDETHNSNQSPSKPIPLAPPQLFYTREETCRLLKISKNAFYKIVNSGKLKARRHTNMTVVLHEDIQDFVRQLPETKDTASRRPVPSET